MSNGTSGAAAGPPAVDVPLYRTATGQKLHIPPCPHVQGVPLIEATDETRATREVCTWCRAELDGFGRAYYDSLLDALRAFGAFADTWDPIRALVASLQYDQIWVPYSRSYIALGNGGPVVAWIGKTYVMPVGGELIELPGYGRRPGGGTPREERVGAVCPRCYIQMPLKGACPQCG